MTDVKRFYYSKGDKTFEVLENTDSVVQLFPSIEAQRDQARYSKHMEKWEWDYSNSEGYRVLIGFWKTGSKTLIQFNNTRGELLADPSVFLYWNSGKTMRNKLSRMGGSCSIFHNSLLLQHIEIKSIPEYEEGCICTTKFSYDPELKTIVINALKSTIYYLCPKVLTGLLEIEDLPAEVRDEVNSVIRMNNVEVKVADVNFKGKCVSKEVWICEKLGSVGMYYVRLDGGLQFEASDDDVRNFLRVNSVRLKDRYTVAGTRILDVV